MMLSNILLLHCTKDEHCNHPCSFLEGPSFDSTVIYHEFLEGADGMVPCLVSGQPAVDVRWFRDQQDILSYGRTSAQSMGLKCGTEGFSGALQKWQPTQVILSLQKFVVYSLHCSITSRIVLILLLCTQIFYLYIKQMQYAWKTKLPMQAVLVFDWSVIIPQDKVTWWACHLWPCTFPLHSVLAFCLTEWPAGWLISWLPSCLSEWLSTWLADKAGWKASWHSSCYNTWSVLYIIYIIYNIIYSRGRTLLNSETNGQLQNNTVPFKGGLQSDWTNMNYSIK